MDSMDTRQAPGGADQPQRRRVRTWQPLLVVAVVGLVIGVTALLFSQRDGDEEQPAPSPTASSAPTQEPEEVSVEPPTVPYILDQRLYVDGVQVPGTWWYVESGGDTWLAQRSDGSWWWGAPGVDGGRIDARVDQPPVLSPDGAYVALIDLTERPMLTGFDTFPAGEGFGSAPVDLPSSEDGIPLRVRAVTDEGEVIVQGTRTSLMWLPLSQARPNVVDLDETAPDQVVLQGTAAGLVVVEGPDGSMDATSTEPRLADISPDGRLTTQGTLPTYDDLVVSPGGAWLLWSPPGTLGGEVTEVSTLRARPVAGGAEILLTAPQGWGFANGRWTWENDETMISVLLPTTGTKQTDARLVRCSVTLGACRAFDGAAASAANDG